MIKIKGSKKDGYVITVYGEDGYHGDLQLTYEELMELKKKLSTGVLAK